MRVVFLPVIIIDAVPVQATAQKVHTWELEAVPASILETEINALHQMVMQSIDDRIDLPAVPKTHTVEIEQKASAVSAPINVLVRQRKIVCEQKESAHTQALPVHLAKSPQITFTPVVEQKQTPVKVQKTPAPAPQKIPKTPVITSQKRFEKTAQNKASSQKKQPTAVAAMWSELSGMAVTTCGLFVAAYLIMNGPALGQVLAAKISPFDNTQLTEQMNQIGQDKTQLAKMPPLLPTAGEQPHQIDIPDLQVQIAPLENRIVIPSIGKNIPLVSVPTTNLYQENWSGLEEDIQEGLRSGVVHYPGTAEPGQIGNFFVTGHSSYYLWDPGQYTDVFARLHDLQIGDEYIVFWNQNVHRYRIVERKVVSPKNVDVLSQPDHKHVSTLMTCTPIGTATNRLILVAKPVEQ